MRYAKRAAQVVVGLCLLWCLALWVGGRVLRSRVRADLQTRITQTLGVPTSIDTVAVNLLRGQVSITGMRAQATALGGLGLAVQQVAVKMLPLGGMLFDRRIERLAVQGVKVVLAPQGAWRVHQHPIVVDEVVLRDVELELVATTLLPSVSKITVRIAHAESGATAFATSLAWLFQLRQFDAQFEVAGVAVRLQKQQGVFSVSGGPVGATPVALPFGLHAPAPGKELEAVREFAKRVGQEILRYKAKQLVDGVLPGP